MMMIMIMMMMDMMVMMMTTGGEDAVFTNWPSEKCLSDGTTPRLAGPWEILSSRGNCRP